MWWLSLVEISVANPSESDLDPLPVAAAAPIQASSEIICRVLEKGSGRSVVGDVVLDEARFSLDETGRFRATIAPGTHLLAFEGVDHLPTTFEITVAEGQTFEATYYVERWGDGEALMVYGRAKSDAVSRHTFSEAELRKVPGAFGDPIRATQSLPGVARSQGLNGDIVVRGAEGMNTAVYIDEIPVPYLFHFFVGRSVVNPTLVDDVEFYAGGLPSRFGESTQAVVNVRTLDSQPDAWVHGKITADLMDFGISSEGKIGQHLTWQAGARASWLSQLISLGASISSAANDRSSGYPTVSYLDYTGRVAWENGPDRVSLTALGAHDILKFTPPKLERSLYEDREKALGYDPLELMENGFHRLQLRWDRREGGRTQTTWVAAGPEQEKSLLVGFGALADGVEMGSLSGWNVAARREDSWSLERWGTVRAGADLTLQPIAVKDYRQATPDEIPTTEDCRIGAGLWTDWSIPLGKLEVTPGFRGSVFDFNGQTQFAPDPRLSLRHGLTRRVSWTVYVGGLSQMPPADRYAQGIGNPDIGVQRAWQASTGVDLELPAGLEASMTVYGTYMPDQVVKDERVVMAPVTINGLGSSYTSPSDAPQFVPEFLTTTGVSWGVEGLLRMRSNGGFFGWLTFNLGRSTRHDEEGVFAADYDAPFSVSLVGAQALPKNWGVSGRARVTSGYPFTPYEPAYDVSRDAWFPVRGETNSDRFPVFGQVDIRVDKTWVKNSYKCTFFIDIMNVLNIQNPMLVSYDPTYRERLTQIALPIVPNFGLELEY